MNKVYRASESKKRGQDKKQKKERKTTSDGQIGASGQPEMEVEGKNASRRDCRVCPSKQGIHGALRGNRGYFWEHLVIYRQYQYQSFLSPYFGAL